MRPDRPRGRQAVGWRRSMATAAKPRMWSLMHLAARGTGKAVRSTDGRYICLARSVSSFTSLGPRMRSAALSGLALSSIAAFGLSTFQATAPRLLDHSESQSHEPAPLRLFACDAGGGARCQTTQAFTRATNSRPDSSYRSTLALASRRRGSADGVASSDPPFTVPWISRCNKFIIWILTGTAAASVIAACYIEGFLAGTRIPPRHTTGLFWHAD